MLNAHTHTLSHPNTSKTLMVATLLQKFTLKTQQISVVARRQGTVINMIYKHHPVFGVNEIKI